VSFTDDINLDSRLVNKFNFLESQLDTIHKEVEVISSALFKNGEHLNLVSRLTITEMRLTRIDTDLQEMKQSVKEIQSNLVGLPDKFKNSVRTELEETNKNYVDWRSFGLAIVTFIFASLGIFLKFCLDWFSKG
jgi:chromosome segregation ATPase